MITDKDLQEAIAKCNGKTDPLPDDAILMAACMTIQDHLNAAPIYSTAADPPTIDTSGDTVREYGNSEFLQAIRGKKSAAMWAVMDELMDTLSMVNPRAYDNVMRQIRR